MWPMQTAPWRRNAMAQAPFADDISRNLTEITAIGATNEENVVRPQDASHHLHGLSGELAEVTHKLSARPASATGTWPPSLRTARAHSTGFARDHIIFFAKRLVIAAL